MNMPLTPEAPAELFASKGGAIPACSESLVKRSVPHPTGTADPRPAPDPAKGPDAAQEDGPASVLSIDLRSVLVPAPEVAAAPAAEAPSAPVVTRAAAPAPSVTRAAMPPPPQPQGRAMAGPLVAAMVAIGTAAGVFFLLNTDRLTVSRMADVPAAEGPANTSSAEAAGTTEAGQEPTQENAAAQESESPAVSGAPGTTADVTAQDAINEAVNEAGDDTSGDGGLPSFDLVRVEPDGSAVIAGRAAPHDELILLHNGQPIGKVKADWAGEWAFVTDQPLPAERHEITLLVNEPDAEITLPQGAEPPARAGGLGDSRPQ